MSTTRVEQSSEIRFEAGSDQSEYDEATTNKLVVVNGEYRREGGLAKRYGFAEQSSAAGSADLRAVLPAGGGQVLLHKRSAILRTGAKGDQTHTYFHANVRSVANYAGAPDASGSERGWTEVDAATLTATTGGVTTRWICTVVTSKQGDAHYAISNADSGVVAQAGALESTALMPRVLALGSSFYFVYVKSGVGIRAQSFDMSATGVSGSSSASTIVSSATVDTGLASFDACMATSSIYLITYVDGVNIVVASVAASTGIIGTSTNFAHGGGTHRLSICFANDSTTHIADGRDATTYRVLRFNSSLTHTTTTVPSGQTNRTHLRIGIGTHPGDSAPGVFVVAYDNANDVLCYSKLDTGHVAATADATIPGLTLLSKPWIEYATGSTNHNSTATVYGAVVGVRDASYGGSGTLAPAHAVRFPVTGTTLAAHDSVEPLATLVADGGFSYPPHVATTRAGMLPSVSQVRATDGQDIPTTDLYIPVLRLTDAFNSIGNDVDGKKPVVYAARVMRLEHAANDSLPRCLAGTAGLLGGACPRYADTADFGEIAVLRQPAPVTTSDAGAGSMGAGTYSYYLVLAYIDVRGNIRRSSPSVVTSQAIAASHKIDVVCNHTIPTAYSPTDDSPAGQWVAELYRTEAGGSVARLLTQKTIAPSGSFTFSDNTPDASIIANRILYTESELAAEPCPPLSALTFHANRVWGVDASDRRRLVYSKEIQEGYVPEFNGTLALRIDGASGDIQCLASMDDKLVAFASDAVYIVTGAGPDRNGNGTFNPVEVAVPGVGASGPYSAVSTPLGVLFHSPYGMRLLGRDLSVTDVSGPIGEYLGAGMTPRVATHIPAMSRAYFILGADRDSADCTYATLVFDYARGRARWYVHLTNAFSDAFRFLDVADVGGTPTFVGGRGSGSGTHYVLTRSSSTYLDVNSTYVEMSATVTGWRPAGLLTECRVRRVHVVTSGSGTNTDGLELDVFDARQPRSHDVDASEVYTWSAALLQDTNYGHVTARLKYQRVNALTFMLITDGSGDDSGPVLHALIVDWEPTSGGRNARRGPSYRGA